MSLIRGTLQSTSSSSVNRHAARIGRAAFLLPAAMISPDSGLPPWITNFSIALDYCAPGGAGGLASGRWLGFREVTAPTRDEAWALLCEWTESDSLRKHALGVEAAMRAYARLYGEDEERWAVTALVHDLDYERYPDLETGHPRMALEELRQLGYPDDVIDAVAGHAEFIGVPRETTMARALYAVDELSGFVAACALVRPTGIEGMNPKSVRRSSSSPRSRPRWTATRSRRRSRSSASTRPSTSSS